ncbi:DUF3429 domain-containing protein [Sandarakinorhabdus sp. DWP1-3-1]|uniref:DUF3429 domain-containing protein n=1 Tax=Sandarakinorhabdus sp. DWP1-3-1 TaxID=2804627 RepID=UPI003CF0841D
MAGGDTVAIPRVVLGYGSLGLMPFLAPPLLSLATPAHVEPLALLALGYAALILSFLGGARWGMAVQRPAPQFLTISLAMLPTIAGLVLLLLPGLPRAVQLSAMAALLVLHFIWDARAADAPRWYPRLRGWLTFGAVLGLMAMASIMAKAARATDAMMI